MRKNLSDTLQLLGQLIESFGGGGDITLEEAMQCMENHSVADLEVTCYVNEICQPVVRFTNHREEMEHPLVLNIELGEYRSRVVVKLRHGESVERRLPQRYGRIFITTAEGSYYHFLLLKEPKFVFGEPEKTGSGMIRMEIRNAGGDMQKAITVGLSDEDDLIVCRSSVLLRHNQTRVLSLEPTERLKVWLRQPENLIVEFNLSETARVD